MLNGAIAAILFFVWVWIGVRIYQYVWPESDDLQPGPDSSWFQKWARRSGPEYFIVFWIGTLLLYFIQAEAMQRTCGSLGDMLFSWMFFSAGLAMVFLFGTLLVIAIVGIIVAVIASLFVVMAVALEGLRKVSPETKTLPSLGPKKALISLGAILIFGLFVWAGAQPNPLCGADFKDSAELEALSEDLVPDVDAIRATLEAHNPDLLDDFNLLIENGEKQ